jgi:CheY-like chemotaxis protein
MNKNGPILIIEDDRDDQELIRHVYKQMEYTNDLIFLEDGEEAIAYLVNMKQAPFIIISDLNMPKIDGLELKKRLQGDPALNIQCIPYIILSTNASKKYVEKAYALSIQGYFQKPSSSNDLREILKDVIDYWKKSFAPGMYLAYA